MKMKVNLFADADALAYSEKKWSELIDMDPAKITECLSNGKGMHSKENAKTLASLEELIKASVDFLPHTLKDRKNNEEYKSKIVAWRRHLSSEREKLKQQCTPNYLADEVNGILKGSKFKGRCNNLILSKCFHILGEDNFTPESIASLMKDYSYTDWVTLSVPLKIVKKTLKWNSVDSQTAETAELESDEKNKPAKKALTEQAEAMYLFPYSCTTSASIKQLKAKIENDLNVVRDFTKWANKSGLYMLTPSYKAKYEEFRSKLQTLPREKMTRKQKEDVVVEDKKPLFIPSQPAMSPYEIAMDKFENNMLMTKADQLAMLLKSRCPYCGRKMNRLNNREGTPYLRCELCDYTAGLENGIPYVNSKYLNGILPQKSSR